VSDNANAATGLRVASPNFYGTRIARDITSVFIILVPTIVSGRLNVVKDRKRTNPIVGFRRS
jgi:hypothetical protein